MSSRSHPRPEPNPLRYERQNNRRSGDYNTHRSGDYNHNYMPQNTYQTAPHPQPAQPLYYGQNSQYQQPPPPGGAQYYHEQPAPPQSSHSHHNSHPHHDSRTHHNSSKEKSGRRFPMSDRFKSKQRRGPDSAPRKHRKKTSAITQHFVAASGEFVGTIMFLWFAFAWHLTVSNRAAASAVATGTPPTAETVMFISLGYGFSLLVAAWGWYRISGGLFNPAVVMGMVLTGSLPPIRGLFLVPAEIIGAIVAAALVECMFPGDIATVNTLLADDTSIARGVFIEMFLTALLLFTIHMLAAEKTKATFIAPLAIGLSLFVAELAGVLYTGGSLNPARSFGPAVVSGQFPGYHWIYWVGPALGALITAGYYRFVKALNYEEANPGQDSSGGDFGRQDSSGGE